VEHARRNMTIALGAALAVLGVAMIAITLARGGAGLTVGILVGVAFTILGCARVYLALATRPQRRP
jgi:hypothetical protein